MSRDSGLAWGIHWLVLGVAAIVFVLGLIVHAFSGLELRQRSQKAECKSGHVEACMAVGKFYEDRADGPIAFFLDNGNVAMDYYDRACKLGVAKGCERLAYDEINTDSAGSSSFDHQDAARGFARACLDGVDEACTELDDFYRDARGAAVAEDIASELFADACKSGKPAGCYRYGLFATEAHHRLKADPALARRMFTKACDAGLQDACKQLR